MFPKENVTSKINSAAFYTVPKTSLEALSTFKVKEKRETLLTLIYSGPDATQRAVTVRFYRNGALTQRSSQSL